MKTKPIISNCMKMSGSHCLCKVAPRADQRVCCVCEKHFMIKEVIV